MTTFLSDEELIAEWRYRYAERIGILCGSGEPTHQQKTLAAAEADAWEKDYHDSNGELCHGAASGAPNSNPPASAPLA
jgi:hypothetical protein